ncbi:MAG: membrane protein insertase YidC [Gammaproteobacteria bacterium]|nr:membrane protein insertase YidC [Gammaproteobacteria bacterium]
MENQRLFIFIALVFLGMIIYQEWEREYGENGVKTTAQVISQKSTVPSPSVIPADNVIATPSSPNDVPVASQSLKPESPTISGESNKLDSAGQIHVVTDYLDVYLDKIGGDIRRVALKKFPIEKDKPEDPFVLMTDKGAKLFVAQSGFAMSKGAGPSHKAVFSSAKDSYALEEGKDNLQVVLTWSDASGVKVTKTYTFHRASHLIDINNKVENGSTTSWEGSFYKQQQRTQFGQESQSMFMMRTYMGGVIYTPEELYEKISFSDMVDQDLDRKNIKGGWIGMMQHYFVGAWIPPADEINSFSSSVINYRYYLRMVGQLITIEPSESKEFKSQYYAGPKDQNVLGELSPGLELTADYGFLTIIAKPLFWLLNIFYGIFGNWGWAIIFLTVTIKLVFFKLSETSYRSMANMRKLQPRMKALKERHGDDRQKMNQSLMELYKKEKINPLGGCLPILVQIPVFISLYWVLMEAVELRQAPFMLWINDLSVQDPYYILPVFMGITMLIQQRLNPAPLDPVQAKVMMALPLVFTVFFLFFPAGLVLYWVVNNTLSIAQQYVITKRVEAAK